MRRPNPEKAASRFRVLQHGRRAPCPYFQKAWPDQFAMSDNFHQSMSGGTGVNHSCWVHGDAIGSATARGIPPRRARCEGTWAIRGQEYTRGRESNAAPGTTIGMRRMATARLIQQLLDPGQPGVSPWMKYTEIIARGPSIRRCEPGHYYSSNNFNPGYFGRRQQ